MKDYVWKSSLSKHIQDHIALQKESGRSSGSKSRISKDLTTITFIVVTKEPNLRGKLQKGSYMSKVKAATAGGERKCCYAIWECI